MRIVKEKIEDTIFGGKKMNKVTNDIYEVGVNDHLIDLFEGQYAVKNGMSYNSYVILDEKIAVLDTVDQNFASEWLDQVEEVLQGRKPDYLIIQHMEPDHSANILNFLKTYPDTVVVGNAKTFTMIQQFFHTSLEHFLVVKEGETLSLGQHELTFVFAPMVHWPEVMMTYDKKDKVFFSADAFGKFGALDVQEEWVNEARRYYIGIVGKYGLQVQNLLKKAKGLDIAMICPLHGPVLKEDLGYYLHLYNLWSSYQAEEKGIVIVYSSVYGNTKEAALLLKEKLEEKKAKVVIYDLARSDMSLVISETFRYEKIVFAAITYNATIFPFMNTFIEGLLERNFQNRTIGLIENGSWAPMANQVIKNKLSNAKNLTFLEPMIRILSHMSEENKEQIEQLVNALIQ